MKRRSEFEPAFSLLVPDNSAVLGLETWQFEPDRAARLRLDVDKRRKTSDRQVLDFGRRHFRAMLAKPRGEIDDPSLGRPPVRDGKSCELSQCHGQTSHSQCLPLYVRQRLNKA